MTSEGRPDASAAAYGGKNWSPRTASLREEVGVVWRECGLASEWEPLRAVLLHRPGAELDVVTDPDASLMLAPLDPAAVRAQHDELAEAYRSAGVSVHYVEPAETPPPNQMFCADVLFMTPEGAVLGRPASTVRAGEERWIAARLARMGIPILRTIRGHGVFEGADALWLSPHRVMVGRGLRTNAEGAVQVAATLEEQGVSTVEVEVPHAAMHLMGQIRIVDRDLAFVRRDRTSRRAVEALEEEGYRVAFFASEEEIRDGMANNFVVLGPRRVLLPAGNPVSMAALEAEGVECVEVPVGAITRAAGAIGCLTGVLARGSVTDP